MSSYPWLVSQLNTPKVLWYQTDVSVVLRIMLIDVQNYFLLIDRDHVRFSTTIDEQKYYLCLYLFGAVIPEKCEHSNVGREIRVIIPKAHRWTKWTRLCIDFNKNPQIISDPDRVEKEEFKLRKCREWDNLAEYKSKNNITQILPVVPSSDEEESDDEKMDALFDLM